MEIVLITLGMVGFGAIVIAAYVFTVAARNYVSTDEDLYRNGLAVQSAEDFVPRKTEDRRRNTVQPQFPMIINSVVIPRDRRRSAERRITA
jgi:hypothetical protein